MRQAVVVIHGIGEQRPMDTIRGFVEQVLPERKKPGQKRYHTKMNKLVDSYEMRVIRFLRQESIPTTDYYEFYWAHHMLDSRYSQVLFWIAKILLRFPGRLPRSLRPIYFGIWGSTILVTVLLLSGLLGAGQGWFHNLQVFYTRFQVPIAILLAVTQSVLAWFMLRYVADAARYLTPTPDNIVQRNNIRKEGLALLKSLHESGKYQRIVVVGHSLGSVVGYDLIRLLWEDYRLPQALARKKHPVLKTFHEDVNDIFMKNIGTGAKVEEFQQKQHALWRELRDADYRMKWLITDFITLGSPLTHASFLLADNDAELQKRMSEYEYPACPPFPSDGEKTYYEKNQANNGNKVMHKILNEGAPFACTRWSNIYFPYKWLVFGDIIGGPLCGLFGQGIKDIPVKVERSHDGDRATGLFQNLIAPSVASHICYWRRFDHYTRLEALENALYKNVDRTSISTLKSCLLLDSLRSKKPWPPP